MRDAERNSDKCLDGLGIVVAPWKSDSKQIVRALLAHYEGEKPAQWNVYTEASGKLLGNVFLLAYLLVYRVSESAVPGGRIRLTREQDPDYGHLSRYIADLRSDLTRRGGKNTSQILKRALISTFPVKGRKPESVLYAGSCLRPDGVFFWLEDEYRNTAGKMLAEGDEISISPEEVRPSARASAVLGKLTDRVRSYVTAGGSHTCEAYYYLTPAEDLLKTDSPERGQWFRRTGPIAVDFEDGKVCRRPAEVSKIRNAFERQQTVVVEGETASGKSVVAKEVAYSLLTDDTALPSYWIDCALLGDVNKKALYDEVMGIEGLLIVDDAHVLAHQVEQLYNLVRRQNGPLLLLISRPSIWSQLDPKESELIGLEDSAITIVADDVTDRIIDAYAEEHSDLPWLNRDIMAIDAQAADNLWMLACVLKGYVGASGEGAPEDWGASGAQSYLRRLGSQMPGHDPMYPRIIVAISAFYQDETIVKGAFLEDRLGFDAKTLQRLSSLGEITKVVKWGANMYGMRHSALAELFWQVGTEYKVLASGAMLPSYEELVYQYALSGASNGLEAVLKAPKGSFERLLQRLSSEEKIADLVGWGRSKTSVHVLVKYMPTGMSFTNELVNVIGERLREWDSMYKVVGIISDAYKKNARVGEQLWDIVGPDLIIEKAYQTNNFCLYDLAWCLSSIASLGFDQVKEMAVRLDCDHIASMFMVSDKNVGAEDFVYRLERAAPDVTESIWKKLNKRDMARMMVKRWSLLGIGQFVAGIAKTRLKFLEEILEELEAAGVHERFSECHDDQEALYGLEGIYKADEEFARSLCRQVDTKEAASRIAHSEDLSYTGDYIELFCKIHSDAGREFIGHLREYEEDLGQSMTGWVDGPGSFLGKIRKLDENLAANICEHVNVKRLTQLLGVTFRFKNFGTILDCLDRFHPDKAAQVCGGLADDNLNSLIDNLNDAPIVKNAVFFVRVVENISPEVGEAIRVGITDTEIMNALETET